MGVKKMSVRNKEEIERINQAINIVHNKFNVIVNDGCWNCKYGGRWDVCSGRVCKPLTEELEKELRKMNIFEKFEFMVDDANKCPFWERKN
jgi:hypothetical protein